MTLERLEQRREYMRAVDKRRRELDPQRSARVRANNPEHYREYRRRYRER